MPWYVAAGWAIDLFLGDERRVHGDIEIAVPDVRFDEVAVALEGFELHAHGHQTWVREPAGPWRLDVFREPSDGGTWICRRDPRIRLAYDDLIERNGAGIPYARPEVVLLFKAKRVEARDDDDFEAVLPRLDPSRRRWLAEALALVHPGHRWRSRLD